MRPATRCCHLPHLAPLSVGCLKSEASLFHRVLPFLLLPLRRIPVLPHYRTSTPRPPQVVALRRRRYPLRPPLIAPWDFTISRFLQLQKNQLMTCRPLLPCLSVPAGVPPPHCASRSTCHPFPVRAPRPSPTLRAHALPRLDPVSRPCSLQNRSRGSCLSQLPLSLSAMTSSQCALGRLYVS